MKYKTAIAVAVLLLTSACQHSDGMVDDMANNIAEINAPAKISNSDIASCVRTVLTLDEGRWAYMGTIARGNGKFRTYATTSVHTAVGPDTWAMKSFGGDVGGDEETAEIGYVKLVGASVIPVENDVLNEEGAIEYTSCVGPDAEGRYEATLKYTLPHNDGSKLTVNNLTWFSEHGSYFVEDLIHESGHVIARRSGVNTPIGE